MPPTLQTTTTSLSPAETLLAAKRFFSLQNSVYSSFIDMEGPNFATFRGQGGEEIAIGVVSENGVTAVTASTYLFDQQLARFLASLPLAPLAMPVESEAQPQLAAPAEETV